MKSTVLKSILVFFSCVVLSWDYIRQSEYVSVKILMVLLVILLGSYSFLGNIGSKLVGYKIKKFIVFTFVFILGTYEFLDRMSILNFGSSLSKNFGDLLAVVLATNILEISSFAENFRSLLFIKSIVFLVSIFAYYYAFHIRMCYRFNNVIEKINFTAICIVVLCLATNINFPIRNFAVLVHKYINEISNVEEFANKKETFCWNAFSQINGKSTVVIVLGETTRGNHMSINGYDRKTTPNLEREDIISYRNAISNGMHTLAGTPFIMTRKPIEKEYIYKVYPEKSIISAYKEAGYKTYYVSYLGNVIAGDDAINQIVNEADKYIKRPYGYHGNGDSEGLPIINEILESDKSEKRLIVYKLIGSHFHFQDRYPSQFDIYQPSFKTVKFKGPNIDQKEIFINSYDNSILHTDYVVSSIINKLKDETGDVVLGFISDHGTGLYEDNKTLYNGYSRANYDIAYFFWLNQNVKDRLGNKNLSMLRENVDKPIDQTYFIDTMFKISGIVSDKQIGKTLFSEISDNDDRKVIVGDEVKFYRDILK